MTVTTPSMSQISPTLRASSPSPDATPSLALGACPDLDRSFSASTTSSLSSRSVSSSSDGNVASRRRGYMRPQGTDFSDSARSRDSVMSLGSIAHMQYYFARTGLLDGKGGQLAKKSERDRLRNSDGSVKIIDSEDESAMDDGPHCGGADTYSDETERSWIHTQEPVMLPPTVSTYKYKPSPLQPLPDLSVLRRELHESLEDAQKLLIESASIRPTEHDRSIVGHDTDSIPEESSHVLDSQGWYEIQGLHILDIVTLAIRAAKNYYTCHSNPGRLYAIRSEREIRSDLYQALDKVKRAANRNFRGGFHESERQGILDWISSIFKFLDQEETLEQQEHALREQWSWLQGDWQEREREREWLFLGSFVTSADPLPEWTAPTQDGSSPFLVSLQTGLGLIQLHNELVGRSDRRFGSIETYHKDVGKPYRCADNLRYWVKAAELRWDTKLDLNALDVVQGRDLASWQQFDQALLKWSKAVREELTSEWLNGEGNASPTRLEGQA